MVGGRSAAQLDPALHRSGQKRASLNLVEPAERAKSGKFLHTLTTAGSIQILCVKGDNCVETWVQTLL